MSQKTGRNSGRFYGKYRGTVTNVSDPNHMGRIKFNCPDVFGSANVESAWALPCTNCAYDGGGDIALPRIGETVWVEFEQGNSNKPIWVGNFWTSNNTPYNAGGDIKEEYGNTSRIISYNGCSILMKNGSVTVSNGTGSVNVTHNSITVKGNAVIDGSATITGATTIMGDVDIQGKLSVEKKSTFAKAVTVEDEMTCKNLEVEEKAVITEDLEVMQNVTITEKLNVTGDTTLTNLKVSSVTTGSCNHTTY